jgi:hypothetical protein
LGFDWRWGAAWFESQLVDHDVEVEPDERQIILDTLVNVHLFFINVIFKGQLW